jgi:protein-disulfide isomerase
MKKDVYRLGGIAAVLVIALVVAISFYRSEEARKASQRAKEQAAMNSSVFVRPHSHSLGPEDAKVTIVEFFDPECESCRLMHPLVKRILGQYPNRVRLVLRYMPLHENSEYAAGALEAAGEQNRYWEMLDALFLHQPVWGSHESPRPDLIPGYARQLGLDMKAFQRFMDAGSYRSLVAIDRADGMALGIRGTPSFFVNERPLLRLGYDSLKSMVDQELAR